VHEDGLTLFHSRWALSYMRGPLGRDEIKRLTAQGASQTVDPQPASRSVSATPATDRQARQDVGRPVVPPGVPEYFAPDAAAGVSVPLTAAAYGAVQVRFVDPALKVDVTRLVTLLSPLREGPVPVDWQGAVRIDWSPEMLERDAPDGVLFSAVPGAAMKPKNYDVWTRQLAAAVTATESLALVKSPSTGELSRPGESEREFRARLQQASREVRDRAVEALRRKYAPRQAALEDKLRRSQQALSRETDQASGQKLQTAISVGATLVGALLGRKSLTGTIGRATTAARGVGRSMKEADDIDRAKRHFSEIQDQRRQLDDELRAESAVIDAGSDVATERLETVTIKPKKTNVAVKLVALVWTLSLRG
jgi:hypothetical protein